VASGAPSAAAAAARGPSLSAPQAILTAAGTGQWLYGRSPNQRVAIASTTKLMTALLTLEHVHRLGRMFTQNLYYSAAADSQIGLVPGERMSVHDLLIALLLPSADDAAEDLAYNVGQGSVARFVGMMNARARELHLTHTHYSTPIGLDTPGNYSSAADLAKLATYLLAHSRYFARVVGLPHATLSSGNHVRYVVNRNDLVARFPWIHGVKTGHTSQAGYVLVGAATRAGMTLISVVLGTSSESSRDDNTLALLDYGFRTFHLATPLRAGQVLARPTVKDRPGVRVAVIAERGFSQVLPLSEPVHLRLAIPAQLAGPLARHAVVGQVAVLAGRRTLTRIPVLLTRALPAVSPLTLAARFLTRGTTLLLLLALVGVVVGVAGVWRVRGRGRETAGSQAA
jgi:D-alanyl-D-alanine carboxypeptidase (penicillin-binding protein 5/6)